MSNGLALVLGLAIAGLLLLDALLFDMGATLVAMRKGLDLIGWLAFWR